MFENIGNSIGGIAGAGRSAKGYDAALEMYRKLQRQAKENREYMDPFGRDRRVEAGDTYWQAMYDPSVIETTGQYKFVMDQAMQAVRRHSSATGYGAGAGSSGNVAAALQDRAAGLASKEYTSIMDRLQNLSGANASYGQQAGQTYINALSDAVAGAAGAKISKENSYAQMHHMGHRLVGQSVDTAMMGFGMSDAKLKKDIKEIGKDGKLTKYEWTWNGRAKEVFGLEGKDTGYIAQEVQKVLPEAVTTVNGYLAIDYGYLAEVNT